MTGKELILYILQNNLENENVFENGLFVGFMTEEEAAVELGVGVAAMRTLHVTGIYKGVMIGDKLYFPRKHMRGDKDGQ